VAVATLDDARAPARAALPLRHVAAVAAGNALGFYDFLTYAFFAVQIGHTFFPSRDPASSLLLSLATFGAGFFTRPLGGIVIGILGDRKGRKPAMFVSFSLMGAAIVGMALTPSYRAIGVAAPILAISFRLLQGFALGGEVGPTTAYLIEAAHERNRGLFGSLQYATQDLAILCAGLVGVALANILDAAALDAWGWRIAFLIGTAIVPFALLIRRQLPKTLDERPPVRKSREPLRPHLRVALFGLLLLGSGTIASYVLIYMTTYATTTLHIASNYAFGATVVGGFCGVCFDPVSGWLSDRFGRKPVMMVPWALLFFAVLPVFMLMAHFRSAGALYAATAAMQILVSLGSPAVVTAIAEALPPHIRSGALSTIYAVAISTFGGTTQFVITWLIARTGNPLAPAWYLMGAIVVGLVTMFAFEETAPAAVLSRRAQ
jgi:MHS family citrate/tricarballylate:H+ symporter-like MFS transporter